MFRNCVAFRWEYFFVSYLPEKKCVKCLIWKMARSCALSLSIRTHSYTRSTQDEISTKPELHVLCGRRGVYTRLYTILGERVLSNPSYRGDKRPRSVEKLTHTRATFGTTARARALGFSATVEVTAPSPPFAHTFPKSGVSTLLSGVSGCATNGTGLSTRGRRLQTLRSTT